MTPICQLLLNCRSKKVLMAQNTHSILFKHLSDLLLLLLTNMVMYLNAELQKIILSSNMKVRKQKK